ncbi:MAG: nucleoside hydrolase-like domain-containing protein [Verrucomicrobiota bacterium]
MNFRFLTPALALYLLSFLISFATAKPKVWIYSDGADRALERAPGKHITDPDDISALANYLLMSNQFETLGVVVGGNRNASPEQRKLSMKTWAEELFLKAYLEDLPKLNDEIGGYQHSIRFIESYIWSNPEKFDLEKNYTDIAAYPSVKILFDELVESDEPIYVLCWGMLTEPAILIRHCIERERLDVLEKARFISHWTNSYFHVGSIEKPEHVHNAFNDAEAAAYTKQMALEAKVTFYECAAIGEAGIVAGSPKGREFYNQFKDSALGRIYVTGKFARNKNTVDDSDSATHWVLLGDYGVNLKDIAHDGTNTPETERRNEASFFKNAHRIRNELLRRAKAVGS